MDCTNFIVRLFLLTYLDLIFELSLNLLFSKHNNYPFVGQQKQGRLRPVPMTEHSVDSPEISPVNPYTQQIWL